jgi:oxygen-independent coproporphyrinogen-3 oxidase
VRKPGSPNRGDGVGERFQTARHRGGGSPTFLSPQGLRRLWEAFAGCFPIAPDAEIAAEIDPRITTHEHLETLRGVGFNRVSLGVQDFDPRVQKAVNREQPFELVERVVGWCRHLGFASVSFDRIYAVPFQTLEGMDEGIVEHDAGPVRLTQPLGRLLVRVVAAVFDRYLPPTAYREGLAPQQSSRVG